MLPSPTPPLSFPSSSSPPRIWPLSLFRSPCAPPPAFFSRADHHRPSSGCGHRAPIASRALDLLYLAPSTRFSVVTADASGRAPPRVASPIFFFLPPCVCALDFHRRLCGSCWTDCPVANSFLAAKIGDIKKYFVRTRLVLKMDVGVHEMTMEDEEDDFMLSRNYFLAKEIGSSSRKKSSQKHVVDINHVDYKLQKHENEIQHLIKSYRNLYPKWLFELRCSFGLLMYGFGSKKALLEDFASTSLTDFGVVVINGYLPSNNLKQALITLAEVLSDQLKHERKSSTRSKSNTEHTFSSLSIEDLLSFLNVQLPQDNNCFVCVIIHNIDGPSLRDPDSQQYLAQLASCSRVRMVASIDHVNAPLLWDKKMVHTQFKWSWHHVPTFAPYKAEGNFFPLILANYGNAQTTKTALVVLQSLTPNAQSVFKILAEHQLANEKEGMPNSTLYTKCRARFLVKEKLVKISVNGVEAGFNMYLDHKGEAFFLRDAEDGEQEFFMSPPTSGDETEGRTKNDQFEKTQSFYVEGGQKEMVTQVDNENDKLVTMSSKGSTILGFVFDLLGSATTLLSKPPRSGAYR
ncbi:hypothetical protein ZIOFF_063056 [Zingiber officinale]|uniref:Origin recognition complex subunit 2 n=1 Tax=Zingiber officinale TaxID=94328 RepID=A0A8J5F5V4_ZINOF|nr:hypothetical protein ZIOFF_063056 [Zingiber officinale]